MPRRALRKKAKLASSNAFGRWFAYWLARWKARYFCHVATGCVSSSAAPSFSADTSLARKCCTLPRPLGSSAMSQSMAGIIFASPARSVGLLIAWMSRCFSGGQWTSAIFVSSAMMAAALSPGVLSPISSRMRVTYVS
jgi:hypothetical protein